MGTDRRYESESAPSFATERYGELEGKHVIPSSRIAINARIYKIDLTPGPKPKGPGKGLGGR